MARFQIAGHNAADWAASNPALLDREYAAERDTGKFKLGDGTTAWNSLAYLTFWSSFARLSGAVSDNAALVTALAAKISTSALDTDGTLSANSDAKIASQKATKTYVDNAVTGLFDFKGSTNCSANPNYPAASKGDAYVVSTAGKIGGASGASVDVGDVYVASADNAGGTQASVGSSWFVLEHNLVGALLSANNLSDLTSASAARGNLGLGSVDNTADVAKAVLSATKLATARNIAGNSFDGTANISINDTDLSGAAWTSFTPTLTPGGGSFTTTSAAGAYKKIGKTVFFRMKLTITTAGSASSYVNASLPSAPANVSSDQSASGYEEGLSNNVAVTGKINNNLALVTIFKYDGTSIIASGAVIIISGCYEAA